MFMLNSCFDDSSSSQKMTDKLIVVTVYIFIDNFKPIS